MPDYGKAPSGRKKGSGFFGELKRPDGRISTELSIEVDGEEIPSLVPTLTQKEIDLMLSGAEPTKEIVRKAVESAQSRRELGLSPFYQPLENYYKSERGEDMNMQNWSKIMKYQEGGVIPKPMYLADTQTGQVEGLMGEAGPEAIVPLDQMPPGGMLGGAGPGGNWSDQNNPIMALLQLVQMLQNGGAEQLLQLLAAIANGGQLTPGGAPEEAPLMTAEGESPIPAEATTMTDLINEPPPGQPPGQPPIQQFADGGIIGNLTGWLKSILESQPVQEPQVSPYVGLSDDDLLMNLSAYQSNIPLRTEAFRRWGEGWEEKMGSQTLVPKK